MVVGCIRQFLVLMAALVNVDHLFKITFMFTSVITPVKKTRIPVRD